jgi:ubiquinone/menaquinone biosynthesis C-methylase UbiE
MSRWRAACVTILLALPVFATGPFSRVEGAEPPAVRASSATEAKLPRPLKRYKGRTIAPTMTYHGAPWLTRAERAREEDTAKLLEELRIEQGMTVCDLGCGNGYYTLDLARQVGSNGKVLAVDIQPEMLHLLVERAKQAGVENIEPIQSEPFDPKLPDEAIDLILLVDVYHEFSFPVHMLRAMRESLKPGGRIALVEFRAEDPTVPIKPLHKMSKRQIMKEFPPNGFRLVREFDGLPWQHLMFFERDEQALGADPRDERDADDE